MPRLLTLSIWITLLASCRSHQPQESASSSALPEDRAAASYAIYSQLLGALQIADPWADKTALIRPVTADVVDAGQSCRPKSTGRDSSTNPHQAVHPPPEAHTDFSEILDDFDAHCHQTFSLDARNLHSSRHLQVLTLREVDEFVSTRSGVSMRHPAPTPELLRKYQDAGGLYTFSPVFFNKRRTVALVHVDLFYGDLGAQGSWIALALVDGQWKGAHWSSDSYVS